jgi:two-component system, OmpR family, sensor histidine kinase SenX3
MKLPFKERVFLSLVVVVLAGVLVALAVLQYRWSNEVSDATSARLQATLESHMFSWRDDLSRELTSVLTALQANPSQPLPDMAAQYAQEYQTWSQSAPQNPVSGILLMEAAGTEHARLLQLDTSSNEFKPVDWPAGLTGLHNWLDAHSPDVISSENFRRTLRSRQGPNPGPLGENRFHNRRWPNMDVARSMIDLDEMALVRPQFQQTKNGSALSWTIVLLDRKVLQEHILREITERYFSGSEAGDYQVAVVSLPGQNLIYSSDSGFGNPGTATPDSAMPVFGLPPRGPGSRKGGNARPPGPPPHNQENGQHEKKDAGPTYRAGVLVPLPGRESDWQLLARHRNGSLEAVVANLRRRNLAFSFGVLLVLTAGIGIILISSQRARALARLQMDFVATVSHELRTPLAVISSAAENIADGVVAGKQQLSEYGAEIKNQARQLMQLVEQILLFAATRDKRHHYNLRPLRVTDVIEAALKDTAGVIDAAGFTVEQEIAPNLPPVMGDQRALSHCLQNLITNAVKYGGDARWMRIRAKVYDHDGHFEKVQISVEDKGLGISSSELRRIFEPFYRSRAAAAAQIHGTGLGLSLARDIAEAMGGSMSVSSEPGRGSCFTVYLSFADVSQLQTHPQPATAVNPKLSKT